MGGGGDLRDQPNGGYGLKVGDESNPQDAMKYFFGFLSLVYSIHLSHLTLSTYMMHRLGIFLALPPPPF